MNCKPNELVIVIAEFGEPMYLGHILKTIKYSIRNDGWICEPDLRDEFGDLVAWADEHLRPIRPDETPEESTEAMKRLHDTRKEVKA